MSQEATLLAQSMVKLIRDPKYSEAEITARVIVMLHQVEAGGVRDTLGTLQQMGQIAGCKASLSYGPYGWTCRMVAPVGTLISSTKRSALEAVQAVQESFESAIQVHQKAVA